MPIVGRFGSLAGLGSLILPGGAMESIATVTGNGSASSLTFSSIPQNYQHLQVRLIVRGTRALDSEQLYVRLNGDTGTNYSYHGLYADNPGAFAAAASSTNVMLIGQFPAANISANIMAAAVIDILDYAASSKNRVIRSLFGSDNNGGSTQSSMVWMGSGMRVNTAAVDSVTIVSNGAFTSTTTAALYGLRAP